MDGLIAEHISKTYAGTHGLSFAALRDVSIRLEPGSFTSLVGESGSGKSTLARLLVGLEAPDQGAIFLDGEDTSGWSTEDWRKRRTKLQAVFQDASGTLKNTYVVNSFSGGNITDYGDYASVKMLNTSDPIEQNGDTITFSTSAGLSSA